MSTDRAAQASLPAELATLFELSNDLCCVLTNEGRFEWVNPAWEHVLGWASGELIGRVAWELIHPDDAANTRHSYHDDSVVNFENRYQHKDGSWRSLLWSATRDEKRWYAIAKNVTERRRAEQNTQYRDDRLYRAIIEQTSQGIWALDEHHRTTFVNRQLADMLGCEPHEILGRTVFDFVAEWTNDEVQGALERRRFGVAELSEGTLKRSDGTLVHALIESSPLFDERGEFAGAIGMVTDVTTRHLERMQLELLAGVVESSSDAVVACSLDGSVLTWNPGAERLFGYGRSEIVGRALSTVLPAGDEGLLSFVDAAAADTFVGPVEIEACAKDRSRVPVDLTAFPIRDDKRRPIAIAVTMRDVRDRREAERRIDEGEQLRLTLEQSERAARAELERHALHDPLTTLPNRNLFLDRLMVSLAHAERNRCGVAVLVLGIDRFSLVNEDVGHEFGDQVLKAVAHRLCGVMRAGDTIGRMTGDEFAIVCETVEPGQGAAAALASRVVDAFGEPFAVGGNAIYLTASVGVAWTEEGEPAEALVRRASSALSNAKQRERGSYCVASPGGEPYAGYGRLALRNALRDAMRSDQLRLVYQPIVALSDEAPRALEALLRWDHPGLGPVSPMEFVPVAEDTGLIIPIGEWVLREACSALSQMDNGLAVSVNLSPRQLLHQDLPGVVRSALADADIRPEQLILELTESILVEESDFVGATLAQLKEIGVRLALDDFGTGYSALGYLKRFPFDIVKVDRSFIHGLGTDDGDSAIVGAVLGMARALGLEVVAEGVETEQQLACLTELGADYAQGFYFAKPQSCAELIESAGRNAAV